METRFLFYFDHYSFF